MSDALKHIDLDDEQFEDAPKALRDYAAKLKKALADETARANGLQQTVATHALSSVLGDKGFKNPKAVEKSLLADGIDPLDSSAVETWLTENGDDYAKATGSTETPAPEQNVQTVETPEQATVRSAYEQMSAATSGLRAPADLSKFDAASLEITPDMTPEQVRAVYVKHGI